MATADYRAFLLRGEAFPASGALMLPRFEKSGEWTGVFAHEYFHFLQFAGTGAGRQLTFMFAFLGHATGAFLRNAPEFMSRAPSWYFPLTDWCLAERSEPVGSALRKHFAHLLLQGDTLALFLGWLPIRAPSNRWPSNLPWPWRVARPTGDVLPSVNVNGRARHFGGFHVMETAAAIQGLRMEGPDIQLDANPLCFALDAARRTEMETWPEQYWIGATYVRLHSQIPAELTDCASVMAADIALGCHLEYLADKRPDDVAWEDWQPGWRYVKAVAAIDSLLAGGVRWPRTEEELRLFCDRVCQVHGWPSEPSELVQTSVHTPPSEGDRLRNALFEEAHALRREHLSLWSVGPRQHIIDAAFKWFRPPMILEYGSDRVRAIRTDLTSDMEAWGELWDDTQRSHLAFQLLRPGGSGPIVRRIECFPWAKEGSGSSCSSSNGRCRWYPTPSGVELPSSCPMLHTLRGMCGAKHDRLVPLSQMRS